MKGYRKILIAVDGSDEVLRKGLRLASDERCWVTVLKVVPPYEGDLELVGIRDIGDVLRGGAESAVSEINGAAKAEGALIKTRLEEGPVHERIAEVARQEHCDLIVMGKSRKKGLARLLGGNLLSKVSGIAPCPVLVVGT